VTENTTFSAIAMVANSLSQLDFAVVLVVRSGDRTWIAHILR
jgi:hypothetical protein